MFQYRSMSCYSCLMLYLHGSTHMSSFNLTPNLSFEPRFSMFIIKRLFITQKVNACSPWSPCLFYFVLLNFVEFIC